MWPDLGRYAFHVLASYGAVALGLGGLVLLSAWRGRQVRLALDAAEARKAQNGAA